MSLQDQLDATRAKSAERIPADKRAIMERATNDLRQSGIVDTSLQPGASIPTFALINATGKTTRSEDLLAKGPLVISFYRGGW